MTTYFDHTDVQGRSVSHEAGSRRSGMHRLRCLSLFLLSWGMRLVALAVLPAVLLPLTAQRCLAAGQTLGSSLAAASEPDVLAADNPAQADFDNEWEHYKNPLPRQRHLLRTSSELALLLVVGTGWYWLQQDDNSRDWDLDPTLESLWKKITGEAVRLDDNRVYTNIFNHPFTGAGYYLAARSNGYTAFESFLFTLAASTVWEYFIEYLEMVSLNDQVFSPIGGTVLGEVFYQLGEFFTTSADTKTNRILKWAFGAPQNFHRGLDGTSMPRATSTDRFGFRNDIWHQFSLFGGVGVAGDTMIGEIGVESQIIHLPGYGTRPGQVSGFIDDTMFTQLRVGASFSASGLQDVSVFLKVMLFGYFHQHLTRMQNDMLSGYSLLIGPVTAYELNTHDWSETGSNDVYGIIHILGPSMHLLYTQNTLHLRLIMDFSGDFAAIHAFAVDAFEQVGSLEFAKSVLREEQYYYAFGLTARAQATLTYGGLEVGVSGRYSYYNSIEGLDRRQEDITNDVRTTDTIGSLRTWLAYKIVDDFLHMTFSYERRWRSGTASDGTVSVSEAETERRFLGALLFRF